MTVKKIITCGCSFSDAPWAWNVQLENYFTGIEFENLGMSSQGNELIQKKTSLAVIESLEKYKPEEIIVLVMWSGTERKTFYINNPDIINDAKNKGFQICGKQLADLKNNITHKEQITEANGVTEFNKLGGWFNTNFLYQGINLTKEYFNSTVDIINAVHITIENIIMLQHICKLHNVKFYQQFYRSYVYEDILNNQNNQMINYLYKQLDHSTIISTTGIFEYLRDSIERKPATNKWEHIMNFVFNDTSSSSDKYFNSREDVHPNQLGHNKWLTEVIIPRLTSDNFLK
jgi:hypothetical protein